MSNNQHLGPMSYGEMPFDDAPQWRFLWHLSDEDKQRFQDYVDRTIEGSAMAWSASLIQSAFAFGLPLPGEEGG